MGAVLEEEIKAKRGNELNLKYSEYGLRHSPLSQIICEFLNFLTNTSGQQKVLYVRL